MNQIMEPLLKRSKFGRERMSCIGCRNFQLKVQRLNESQKANEYVKEQLRSQLNEMFQYKTNYNMLADQYQIVSTQNQELKRCETQWQQNFRLGYDEFVLLRERNSSLEQENMKLKAMVKKGCKKYGELHNSSQIADERIVNLEDQLRAAQEQISDLQKDCQEKDKLISRSHKSDLKVHNYCVDLEHQKAELLKEIEEMNRDTKVLHSKYNDLYKEKVRLDELITSLKSKNKKQKREFKEWRSVYGKEMSRQMARMEAELVGVTKENDVLREAVHCLTGEAQAKDVMMEELLAEEMASVVIPSEEKDMDIKLKEEKFEINSNPSETKLLFVMGDVKALAAYNFDGTLKENDLIVDKADVPDEPVSTIVTKKTDLINDGIEKTVVMKTGAAESSAETLAMLYETGCHQEIKQKRKNKKQKRRRRRKQ